MLVRVVRAERCSKVSHLRHVLTLLVASILLVPRVLLATMPHFRSPLARASRHDRALRCGYYTSHNGEGNKFVETDEVVAKRLKAISRSLELWRSDVLQVGKDAHKPIGAALENRHNISDEEFRFRRRARQARNAAAHNPWLKKAQAKWSDLTSDEEEMASDVAVPQVPACPQGVDNPAAVPQVPACAQEIDSPTVVPQVLERAQEFDSPAVFPQVPARAQEPCIPPVIPTVPQCAQGEDCTLRCYFAERQLLGARLQVKHLEAEPRARSSTTHAACNLSNRRKHFPRPNR